MDTESRDRFRQPGGNARRIQQFIGITVPLIALAYILNLPFILFKASPLPQQYLGLFFGLVMTYVFMTIPASKKIKDRSVPWYDVLLALVSLSAGIYVAIFFPQLTLTLGLLFPLKIILGGGAIIAIIEATRRVAGWPLVIIVIVFILYGRFNYLLPGILACTETSWPRLINQLYLSSNFLFGIVLQVLATIVFSFILFGQFLFGTGGANFFLEVAQALMGRYRGGAAKIAIVASSLFGTLSGSAVGNVASVGVVTIPLMKRLGYSPTFAGAVEAVSSTGGCIMPPVMGAAAFVMAEFLQVPYSKVAIAALVPAILYYLGEFIQVDLRAAKLGLKGIPKSELPSLKKSLIAGWMYIIPILVLIYCLFILFLKEENAALYSLGALVLIAAGRKNTRLNFKKFFGLLEQTTRGMLELTVVGAAAGLMVGVITSTGLGLSFAQVLTAVGGGNLVILALMTAVASTILGMGMPAIACYLILVVLVAPAMVQLGVSPLLAHMFIFYFGNLSFLTPPVCMAAYVAGSMAGAPLLPTAWQAMKLAVAAYVVPFIFLFKPSTILIGSPGVILLSLFDGVMGIGTIAIGIEGYFRRELTWFERILFMVDGVAFLVPGWTSRIIGLGLLVLLMIINFKVNRLPAKIDGNVPGY